MALRKIVSERNEEPDDTILPDSLRPSRRTVYNKDCFVSDYPLVVTEKLENSRKITVRFSVKINKLIKRAS